MRFLIDESVTYRLAATLRSRGHDTLTVVTDLTMSMDDESVLAAAVQDGRVLITADRDFGELVFNRGHAHAGVMLLRLSGATLASIEPAIVRVLETHKDVLSEFLVISDTSVRVRRN